MDVNGPEASVGKFIFEQRELDQVTVLSIGGEIDLAVEVELRVAFDRACGRGESLVVNMSGVQFLDSTGIGVVLIARKRLAAEDRELVIAEPTPQVWRVFEITGLDKVLLRFHSEDEAVRHVTGSTRPL